MKYLLTIMMFSLLACDKDDTKDTQNIALPTVTNISTSSEIISGVARPKFTITLSVPDASIVSQLEVYQNAKFPLEKSGKVLSPTSTQYVVIDSSATYPPVAPVKYFAFFTMKDYSYVSYYPFELK
jgi:hypothetical protein